MFTIVWMIWTVLLILFGTDFGNISKIAYIDIGNFAYMKIFMKLL